MDHCRFWWGFDDEISEIAVCAWLSIVSKFIWYALISGNPDGCKINNFYVKTCNEDGKETNSQDRQGAFQLKGTDFEEFEFSKKISSRYFLIECNCSNYAALSVVQMKWILILKSKSVKIASVNYESQTKINNTFKQTKNFHKFKVEFL